MTWLKHNSQPAEVLPDERNGVLNLDLKTATGRLKKYPDIKVSIRMKSPVGPLARDVKIECLYRCDSSSRSEIEIAYFGYDSELMTEQLIQGAKIFADFKAYMLQASEGKK
jgi:hypothetical protein